MKLVRESAPDAACLVWSPIDAAVRTMGGDLVPRRGSRMVADIFRDVAKEGGCAYWDALSAMGDEGSAIRWLSAGLLNEDLIHPRARGSDLLGHLFDLAPSSAYAASHPPRVAAEPAGSTPRQGPHHHLHAPARAGEGRGARGWASFSWAPRTPPRTTSRTRCARADKRFGDAGRGFIAAGKASDRLKPAGVVHELTGEWTVEDALRATVPGQAWGLGGVRAVGAPGPRCASASARAAPPDHAARAPLALLAGWPGTGQVEVKVDGSAVPPEPPPPEPSPRPRCASAPSPSPAPPTRWRCSAGGPLTVLGAALDLERPGLVYDAVGLPGATASTLAGMDPQALAAQLSSRKPQLLVFWYGTNESGQADLDAEKLRAEYGTLIARLRKDAGGAECLVRHHGPAAAARGRPWEEAPGLARCWPCCPWRASRAARTGPRGPPWVGSAACCAGSAPGWATRRHPPDARGLREARGPVPRRPARGLRGLQDPAADLAAEGG